MAHKDTIMRLTIRGNAEFHINASEAQQVLSDRFFYLEVVDDTQVYNARWVEQFKQEPTVRGIFVQKMAKKIENARTDEEKKRLDMALKFGLMELAGPHAD